MKSMKPERKVSLAGRLLRLLKPSGTTQESIGLQEKNVSVGITDDSHSDFRREIKTALLDAERKRAEAMEWQRRKFIC